MHSSVRFVMGTDFVLQPETSQGNILSPHYGAGAFHAGLPLVDSPGICKGAVTEVGISWRE